MIKLSDYLNYLNNEVIQARKMADQNAIAVAKEYAKDEYLKYFRVPRFAMPNIKLNIPVKISELSAKTTYNFKKDYEGILLDVNKRIEATNKEKGLQLKTFDKESFRKNESITKLLNDLEKVDFKPVKSIEENIKKIDFSKVSDKIVKRFEFSTSDENDRKSSESNALAEILRESALANLSPVKVDLNTIFFDPDTSKETDKGKILLTLDVEMIEEGIRIRNVKDKDGKEIEEIVFE